MTRELRVKAIIILIGIAACLFYVYPTLRWAMYSPEKRTELAGDPANDVLGTWKEEEGMLADDDTVGRLALSLKKWWQGDRDRVLNLGLDLQGGMYVVLEVQLDDAVKVQNQNVRERIKDSLLEEDVEYTTILDVSPTEIELSFTNQATASRALTVINADTDYEVMLTTPAEVSGDSFRVRLNGNYIAQTKVRALEQARRVVENRVNELGLTEPSIQVQPPARVIIQLPGEKDPRRVLSLLKQTAKLEFRLSADERLMNRVINSIDRVEKIKDKLLVDRGATEEGVPYIIHKIDDVDTEFFRILLRTPEVQQRVPANYVLMLGRPIPDPQRGRKYRDFILIERDIAIDGTSLRDAKVILGQTATDRQVALALDGRGMARLKSVSRKCEAAYNQDKVVPRLAIVLDDIVYSAPTLTEYIDSNPVIRGSFTEREAADLALVLRSGALPAKLEIAQNRTVGATLGKDSVDRGVNSALLGLSIVLVFMVVYYMVAGAIADLALALNMLILVAVLSFFHATLTLPGIAGIVLTIGMAVDANVLIFERIREELARAKELPRAIREGFGRAFLTIFDANVTTVLTAIILYFLGTGPIRGFALTLIIGIGASMVTALFVCRFIFDFLVQRDILTNLKMLQLFQRPSINFIGKRHITALVSLVLIVLGMSCFAVRALNQGEALAEGSAPEGTTLFSTPMYGIELTGGDMLHIQFSNNVSIAQLRGALAGVGQSDSMIQRIGGGAQFLIRSTFNSSTAIVAALDQQFAADPPEILEEDRIGPAIGEELKTKAVYSIVLALVVIVAYIWYRFQFIYGIAATAALAHDVLITLGALALGGYQISLGVIAALLTIVGYSLNDTIVVFDRIREDLHVERNMSFKDILNLSINQTLSRTTLTSLTTLFVVVCLFVLGGEVIRDFAFTLLVGVIVGTYSSIFVASPLLLLMQRSGRAVKKVTTK